MCTGRMDLSLVLRALTKGADGVFIAGCHLNECNYITHGNFHALSMSYIARKILERIGINPARVQMHLVSGSEGNRFVELVNNFNREMREMGPIGETEGMSREDLVEKLEAVTNLIPYVRLVERERLRIPLRSEEEFAEYFASEEFVKLFNDLIGDKLAVSQIVSLLKKSPLTTSEIAEKVKLTPSEVSKHLISSTKHGLVRFDSTQKHYALA